MTEPKTMAVTANPDPLWTVEQAAEYLDCSTYLIRAQVTNGALQATRIGRFVRVRRSAIERYIEAQTGGAAS